MSKLDTWMPLYIGDYLADTMHLQGAEHGAYLLLLMHYWRNGPLPDDDKVLAGIARIKRREWDNEVGPTVRAFFAIQDDGRLHQKRMDEEKMRAENLSEKRRAAANVRHKPKPTTPSNGPIHDMQMHSNEDAIAQQLDTHARTCASASPSQSQRTEERKERGNPAGSSRAHTRTPARGKALPEDWHPNGQAFALADSLGLDPEDVTTEATKMRDWARHRGEAGKDWDARFANWLRKEAADRQRFRKPPKRTLAEEWNLPSFLHPDSDGITPVMPNRGLLS